ncbi:hypothetical protein Hanom_Chr07g00632161 [Helianthus anomalus]
MLVAQFGINLGLYTEEDAAGPKFTKAIRELPDNLRQAAWALIGDNHYNPRSMKSTKIRDPLIRYIHRVLSGSSCQRDYSGGVVNIREHTIRYFLVTHQPIDVAHILLRIMAANATTDTRMPIFYGGWIERLFKHFIQQTLSLFNKGVGTTKVGLMVCHSMNLIIDCPDGTMRFKDARGRAWNPNDPGMILAIKDIPNRPRPGQFLGSSSQGNPASLKECLQLRPKLKHSDRRHGMQHLLHAT